MREAFPCYTHLLLLQCCGSLLLRQGTEQHSLQRSTDHSTAHRANRALLCWCWCCCCCSPMMTPFCSSCCGACCCRYLTSPCVVCWMVTGFMRLNPGPILARRPAVPARESKGQDHFSGLACLASQADRHTGDRPAQVEVEACCIGGCRLLLLHRHGREVVMWVRYGMTYGCGHRR